MNTLRKLFGIRTKKLVVIKRVKIVSYDYFQNSTLARKTKKNSQV